MTVRVTIGGAAVLLDRDVFTELCENSVASSRAAYGKALESGHITFNDLVELARKADMPYALFFAPPDVVREQVALKSKKLLQGISKQTFSMNARTTVALADVELIVKDLLRKQEELKRIDRTLDKNVVVGALRKPSSDAADDAHRLLELLELSSGDLRSVRTKEAALDMLIARLESKQILVARSQRLFMPQSLDGVKFSGMTIKDAKVPYIFLAGGDEGDHLEPTGRRIFTLTLMAVLIARGIFAVVTFDGNAVNNQDNREYEIVAEMLMPATEFRGVDTSSLSAIKQAADVFKVTPSAVVIRALRLGKIGNADVDGYLDALRVEYAARSLRHSSQPKPVNALRKYNGPEFSRRMLRGLDSGRITPWVVCQNRIRPHQIQEFRMALR